MPEWGVSFELMIPEGVSIDPYITLATFRIRARNPVAALEKGTDAYKRIVEDHADEASGLDAIVEPIPAGEVKTGNGVA